MKIAVRYYTKTGNTKRLAEAIAEAVGAEALPISEAVEEPVDILFLGIPMDACEFHCKGEFKGLHKGKPDASDLKAAAEFARKIAE